MHSNRNKSIERTSIIGGEWIYYKIYSGVEIADEIIRIVNDISEKFVESKLIHLWFFIRYADPKRHLRIRFKCANSEAIALIINEMHGVLNPLIKQDLVWDVTLNSYNREIERYGENSMEYSETIFFYDSVMVADYLNKFDDEMLRWLFSLKAIDSHLDLFQYNLNEKLDLLKALSQGFKNEFVQSKRINQSINDRYRLYREKIGKILDKSDDFKMLYEVLENKNKSLKRIAELIIDLDKKNKLIVDFNDLNSSYIHMLMNRLFPTDNRKMEMICYDFLHRYYKSKIAYNKTSAINLIGK